MSYASNDDVFEMLGVCLQSKAVLSFSFAHYPATWANGGTETGDSVCVVTRRCHSSSCEVCLLALFIRCRWYLRRYLCGHGFMYMVDFRGRAIQVGGRWGPVSPFAVCKYVFFVDVFSVSASPCVYSPTTPTRVTQPAVLNVFAGLFVLFSDICPVVVFDGAFIMAFGSS